MKRKKPYLLAGLVLLLFLLCTACGNTEGQIAPQDDPNEGLGGGFSEDTVNDFSGFEGIWLGEADNDYDSMEFDAEGNWTLYLSGEVVDDGYLRYEPEWEAIYAYSSSDDSGSLITMEEGQLYSAAYGYFNYGEGMEYLWYEDGGHLTEDDEPDPSEDEVPDWNGRLDGDPDSYWSWDSDLCQRNVSEFKGIWYYDGDLSAETYIVIDGILALELWPQRLAGQSVDHTVAVVRFRRGFRNEILPAALTPCDALFLLAEIKLQFQQVQLKGIFNRIPQPVSERQRSARKALVHQRGVCLLQRSIPFPLRGALIIGKTDLQKISNTQLRPAWLVQRLKNCGTFLGRENGRTSVLHRHCVPKMFRGIKSGYGIDSLDPIGQVADLFFKILIVRIRNIHAFQKQRVLRPEPVDHSMVFRKIQRSKPNKFLRWRSAPEFFYAPILANQ